MSIFQITFDGQPITVVSSPVTALAAVQFDLSDAVGLVESQFTGQAQAQKWPGADRLGGTMTFPPLTLAQANDALAFLMQCRGMANAFLIGDPLRTASTGAGGGTPFADNTQNGGNPAGSEYLGTKGWPANTLVLKRGNTFSCNLRLYYALDDVTSDGSGNALINIWPSLRETPTADGTFKTWQLPAGAVTLTSGQPIGNWVFYAEWSNFSLAPGIVLPPDAVIQGIYPTMILANNSNAIPNQIFGVNLDPGSLPSPGGTVIPTPTLPYSTTECYYGTSIGNSLAVLFGQEMAITIGATLANPFTGGFGCSGCGFAVYYTSATPVIDPTMAPPFSVPSGQGLAWAMPFGAGAGSMDPGATNGSSSATPAVLNGAIGVTKATGLFRLASNKRSWSADPSLISRMSFPIQEYR